MSYKINLTTYEAPVVILSSDVTIFVKEALTINGNVDVLQWKLDDFAADIAFKLTKMFAGFWFIQGWLLTVNKHHISQVLTFRKESYHIFYFQDDMVRNMERKVQ